MRAALGLSIARSARRAVRPHGGWASPWRAVRRRHHACAEETSAWQRYLKSKSSPGICGRPSWSATGTRTRAYGRRGLPHAGWRRLSRPMRWCGWTAPSRRCSMKGSACGEPSETSSAFRARRSTGATCLAAPGRRARAVPHRSPINASVDGTRTGVPRASPWRAHPKSPRNPRCSESRRVAWTR